MYGEEGLEAFRAFKSVWNPDWRLNPGKVVDPLPRDRALRLGADYRPWTPETYLAYREVVTAVGIGSADGREGAGSTLGQWGR